MCYILFKKRPSGEKLDERRMKNSLKLTTLATGALTFTGSAMASVVGWPTEPGYIYTSTSASDLWSAGFDNLTENGHLTVVPSWCNGCYTSDSLSTNSLMGFIEIDVTYAPIDAQLGFYVMMDIDYTDPSFQFADMEALIEASDTDIDVMSAGDAGTDWSPFSDWIDNPDATIFHWNPAEFDGSSSNPFETTTLTFGWNFSGYEGLVGGSQFPGVVVNGAGAVPAPGALALLGLAGFATRRRRK